MAHVRLLQDADESDQAVVEYTVERDPVTARTRRSSGARRCASTTSRIAAGARTWWPTHDQEAVAPLLGRRQAQGVGPRAGSTRSPSGSTSCRTRVRIELDRQAGRRPDREVHHPGARRHHGAAGVLTVIGSNLRASGRARRQERGAALLVVMVAVALVTALAMDLAYQARVELQIAANGRDELLAAGPGARCGRPVAAGAPLPGAARYPGLGGGRAGRPARWCRRRPACRRHAAHPGLEAGPGRLLPDLQPLPDAGRSGGADARTSSGASDRPQRGTVPASRRGRGAHGAMATPGRRRPGASGHHRRRGSQGQRPARRRSASSGLPGGPARQLPGAGGRQAVGLRSSTARTPTGSADLPHRPGRRTSRTGSTRTQVQAAVTGMPSKPFENGFGDENYPTTAARSLQGQERPLRLARRSSTW